MGNHRWLKIVCLHRIGDSEFKRLKVAALNLFYPTASPPSQKVGFLILRHSLRGGRSVRLATEVREGGELSNRKENER
jgi:hypothetical protein